MLVGSDQGTDRQTMSVIELSWTAKNTDGGSIALTTAYTASTAYTPYTAYIAHTAYSA